MNFHQRKHKMLGHIKKIHCQYLESCKARQNKFMKKCFKSQVKLLLD